MTEELKDYLLSIKKELNSDHLWKFAKQIINTENINLRDEFGDTLLILLSKSYYDYSERLINLLLNNGADPNISNLNGYTALMYSSGYTSKITKILLEHEADPNIRNENGISPLTRALCSNDFKVSKLLLEHGADPNLQDNYGNSPLIQLLESIIYPATVYKIVDLLLTYGADPDLKNYDGLSAFDYAKEKKQYIILERIFKSKEINNPKIILNESQNKIISLDTKIHDLYFGDNIITQTNELSKIWDSIKTNEELLESALTLFKYQVIAPHICSLILMDYENVDPLAYNVLTNLIANHEEIAYTINPFSKEYKWPLLATLLFNEKLKISKSTKEELFQKIKNLPEELISKDISIPDTIYWAKIHPLFWDAEWKHDVQNTINLNKLLENYHERAKFRKLTKIPF